MTFAPKRHWDDNLVLSTVKLRYATMVFRTAFHTFGAKYNTILGLELSLFIGLLPFICQIIHFKTWINNQ